MDNLNYDKPSTSQATLAYRKLEGLIVEQYFAPGSLLSESQIIEKLGLGRTPIREAVQRLAWEGLIEIRSRIGIKVVELCPEKFIKLLEIRMALEPMMVAEAVRNSTTDDRATLEALRAEILDAESKEDAAAFMRCDRKLDDFLMKKSSNEFLIQVLSPLMAHSRRYWFSYIARDGLKDNLRLHLGVLDACLAGSETQASSAVKDLVQGIIETAKAFVGKQLSPKFLPHDGRPC